MNINIVQLPDGQHYLEIDGQRSNCFPSAEIGSWNHPTEGLIYWKPQPNIEKQVCDKLITKFNSIKTYSGSEL